MIHLLVFALALAGSSSALSEPGTRGDDLEQLLKQVRKEKDSVDVALFRQIAEFKSAAALETLKLCVEPLKDEDILLRAYHAFSAYRDMPGLEEQAIAFLYSEACASKSGAHQRQATQGLTYFYQPAHAALVRLAREHPSDAVRRIALQSVIPLLGDSGKPEDARLILDFAEVRGGRTVQYISDALTACIGTEVEIMLVERFNAQGLSLAWTEILLEAMAARSSGLVDKALINGLKHENSLIRVRALELIGQRGDPEMYTTLRPFLRAKEGLERRQAIISVTGVASDQQFWPGMLKKYARSRHLAERLGATVGLAMMATPQAMEALHGLLRDDDWRVRLETIGQLARVRKRDSIPMLIERMGQESARLRSSIARALRQITGQDHGQNPARWEQWWAADGPEFTVSTRDPGTPARVSVTGRQDGDVTTARFYGLPLISDHVAFVLDSSGSMQSRAGLSGRTRAENSDASETTRLDVVKSELQDALGRMSKNVHFNVIFFNTVVIPWHDELVKRSGREAQSAIGFAQMQNAEGGTDLYGGLMKAFEDATVDTIYLLSDGNPSSGEVVSPDLLRQCILRANALRKIQIHCIAIGQPSPFLRSLAHENDGVYAEAL